MLTVVSDFHLTDGTSGQTINSSAFQIFSDQILDLANRRNARSFRLVLLGDIFDLIRSEVWSRPGVTQRPWKSHSKGQEKITLKILKGILTRNAEGIEHLRNLNKKMKKAGVKTHAPI